ncbi:glycine--tRNA ligase subunit beta [Altererythrobacter sp. MTPC7]|uniref:glycine--tRNA ligase subunit beta n=1 Tax=Altererythrobacter sp. MTPC7 TaxID=3056567 RepID=UPI0036F2A8C1
MSGSDFLLELRSEEIPARMQAGARAELEKLFRREMDAAGVECGAITVWSTPRRLALIARGLPEATEAVSEELKGPPVAAPDQALDGFCRKAGVEKADLEVREVKGRETYFAVKNIPGRATRDLLAEAIPAIIRDFSWPKSMRWGAASISTESLRWVRPLSGIVALLGTDIVECEVHGVTSGAVTLGHRFHHSGDITIGDADDYAMKLRAAHVIVDQEERQDLIRSGAAKVAEEAGLKLVEDEGLVIENAGLTEWPVPLLGRFEEDFLEVPPETIQLTARVNQKYFVCEDEAGELANAFICTANIEAEDGGKRVVDGNRKVLAARLSDARFFWDVDRKKTLAEHAKGLERITFHEKLGTVADKVDRVAKLARWLAEEGIVKADPDLAEQAARLAKADLVTEMVGEFPELQGLMGGYYARAEGQPDEVADAIRDHYKPVGQGDEVPTAPVTVAVSLADKLDNIAKFFEIDELPTGSKDPFALRRAALGIGSLVLINKLRFSLARTFAEHLGLTETDAEILIQNGMMEAAQPQLKTLAQSIRDNPIDFTGIAKSVQQGMQKFQTDVAEIPKRIEAGFAALRNSTVFLADRLKVQQREAGVRHDLIDAVFALGGEDDLVRLLARVHALQAFIATDDGVNLLAGYKRAANILKKEDWQGDDRLSPHTGEEDPLVLVDDPDMKDIVAARAEMSKSLSYTPEPAEKALADALDNSERRAAEAVEAEDFAAAMSALATLRAPIDSFFEEVIVNAGDPDKRSNRLGLLARFRDAVHSVADFSRIEG